MEIVRKRQRINAGYVEPAIGRCIKCGTEVVLDGFTNTCACGADYNMSGQHLAPRSQWGEETGETAEDIIAADARYRNTGINPLDEPDLDH